MRYDFLIDTYDTERLKVLSVWSEFRDEDLAVRPKHDDPRGESTRVVRRPRYLAHRAASR